MHDSSEAPSRHAALGPDALLRRVFDSAVGFALFTTDPNGVVTRWNPGAERLLGSSDAEIVGQRSDVIFPPEKGGAGAAEDERRRDLAHGRAAVLAGTSADIHDPRTAQRTDTTTLEFGPDGVRCTIVVAAAEDKGPACG